LHARGVTAAGSLPEDAEEPYDLDLSERSGDAGSMSVEEMWKNFERSRFASMQPVMTEQPFTLYLGHDLSVAGRIDAIYQGENGEWELVDFKTGKSDPEPMQLALYARAVREIWNQEATCKWFLLRDGREVDAPPIAGLDEVLEAAARGIREVNPLTDSGRKGI
jgi:RecB family exonuclease